MVFCATCYRSGLRCVYDMIVSDLQDFLLQLMMEGKGDAEVFLDIGNVKGTFLKTEHIRFYGEKDGVKLVIIKGEDVF